MVGRRASSDRGSSGADSTRTPTLGRRGFLRASGAGALLAAPAASIRPGATDGQEETGRFPGPMTVEGPPVLEPHPDAANPVVTPADVADREAVRYVADPFVVREDGAYHLFFEVTYDSEDPADSADVAHATSDDGLDWEYRGIVLDDPYHLAYPSVFRWDGTWYMTPDKGTYRYDGVPEFRIYRADSFPTDWTLAERPLVNEHVGDPTLVRRDGRWYLFSVEQEAVHGTRLHHSETLLDGDWTEHPASPVATSTRNFRPAGRPLVGADGTYLFLMDVERTYGDRVRCFEVTELSPTAYEHEEVPESPVLAASRDGGWNADGMHHVDAVLPATGGGEVVPVDGKDADGMWSIGMYRVVDGGG